MSLRCQRETQTETADQGLRGSCCEDSAVAPTRHNQWTMDKGIQYTAVGWFLWTTGARTRSAVRGSDTWPDRHPTYTQVGVWVCRLGLPCARARWARVGSRLDCSTPVPRADTGVLCVSLRGVRRPAVPSSTSLLSPVACVASLDSHLSQAIHIIYHSPGASGLEARA